jgi:Zn-finger nucleic acid-binding protein
MKRETTRAEEQPSFDEHANEDRYFATKEHQLIDELKFEFQSAEAARREAQMMTCPKCSGKLARHRILRFDLDRCKSCEGIWLNKGDLEAILRQQARGPLGVFLDRCFSRNESGKNS